MAASAASAGIPRVKQELDDRSDDGIDDAVLEACDEARNEAYILQHVRIDKATLLAAVNRLSALNKLQLFNTDSGLAFKRVKVSTRHAEMDSYEERLVYQSIEEAGNKGIWTKHLRSQTGLEKAQFNRVIKKMEGKKLIKSVLSVAAVKRKFYLLYELEPDETLTGGAWYTGQDFDSVFIDLMSRAVLDFVKKRAQRAETTYADKPLQRLVASLVTPQQVRRHIEEIELSKELLTDANVMSLLDVLVFDGELESYTEEDLREYTPQELSVDADGDTPMPAVATEAASGGLKRYRFTKAPAVSAGILASPCGVCPVFRECAEGNVVSPETCIYLDKW
eukprot:m.139581 g.139581  ORF g.139581 m.139581 type:complete len:336 (+) comp17633_c0_seq1:412-1419(+)